MKKIILLFLLFLFVAQPLFSERVFERETQAAAIAPMAAKTRVGRYQLVKWLGSGDQAIVYKALDEKENQVALKVFYTKSQMAKVHPERKKSIDTFFASDGSSLAAKSEYEAGAKLSHKRIMKIFAKEEIRLESGEKVNAIVMEYVEGKHLNKIARASVSKKTALKMARQLLSALSHSFKNGLIHDDLWSENIFIDSENNLKLIDIGSYDLLPLARRGEKPKGHYKQYMSVVRRSLVEILDLGKFSTEEKNEVLATLDDIVNKSDNCAISDETRSTIAENLRSMQKALS